MKRILTCSDGTWNRPNVREHGQVIRTNVQRLFDYVQQRDPAGGTVQIKYYDEGVGAQGNLFTRLLNGATGAGIDENIMDAYKFICWNYEPGDQIFLFGFSRGAYTARSLAGLIRKCGIIRENDLDLIRNAYALYRKKDSDPSSVEATGFRKSHSHEVSVIRFIGVWDTVGSLGLPLNALQWYNKRRYAFHDTVLSSIVERAYQALAVDEKRKTFTPTLWTRSGHGQPGGQQILEQRWFPGVHSNVGGGYADCGLSNIPLKWIFEKAIGAGLAVDPGYKDVVCKCDGELYNSRKGVYAFLPGKDREIVVDDREYFIDESVFRRMEQVPGYRPANVLKVRPMPALPQ